MSDIYASCSGYICTGVSQSGNTYTFSRLCASSNLYFASDSSGALYCITPQKKFDLRGWNTQQDKDLYKLFYKTALDIDQDLCVYTGFTYTASNPQEQRCSSSTAQDPELFVE